jgi:hypothetical protein
MAYDTYQRGMTYNPTGQQVGPSQINQNATIAAYHQRQAALQQARGDYHTAHPNAGYMTTGQLYGVGQQNNGTYDPTTAPRPKNWYTDPTGWGNAGGMTTQDVNNQWQQHFMNSGAYNPNGANTGAIQTYSNQPTGAVTPPPPGTTPPPGGGTDTRPTNGGVTTPPAPVTTRATTPPGTTGTMRGGQAYGGNARYTDGIASPPPDLATQGANQNYAGAGDTRTSRTNNYSIDPANYQRGWR